MEVKFTVFALFYFAFEENFPIKSPRGGLYLVGRFNFVLSVLERFSVGRLYEDGCLVPVRRFPSPSWSIRFDDVSEANGREHFRMEHVTPNALAAR